VHFIVLLLCTRLSRGQKPLFFNYGHIQLLTAFSVFAAAHNKSHLRVHAPTGAPTPRCGRGQEYRKIVRGQGPAGAETGQEVAAQQTRHVD